MDLNDLIREIPDGRELRLSRRAEGILIHVADYASGAHARKLIWCADALKGDLNFLILDRVRLVNAMLDREIKDPNHA